MRVAFYVIIGAASFMLLTAQSCTGTADSFESSEATPEKWGDVQLGMTKTEVRSILGSPDNVVPLDPPVLGRTELWYWGQEYEIVFDAQGLVGAKNHY